MVVAAEAAVVPVVAVVFLQDNRSCHGNDNEGEEDTEDDDHDHSDADCASDPDDRNDDGDHSDDNDVRTLHSEMTAR